MASTYTGLGTELMTTGENAGTWGSTTNTNLKIIEQLAGGYIEKSIAGSAQTTTLSVSDGSVDAELAHRIIKFTGTITGNQVVTIPLDVQQMYILVNGTSGAYTVQFKYVSGSGSSLTFATTDKGTKLVYATADDGTNPNLVDTGLGSTGAYDLDGNELTLDADSDTSITASTDDQIDIEVGGTDRVRITTSAIAPSSADGVALGTSALEFSDLFLADSSVIKFGADQDTTLTHTDGTGLTLNSTNKLCFYDTALYIHSSTDGQLDLVADTEIQIAATTIDINGAIAMDGAITGATNITLSGELDSATLDVSGNADIDGTTNLDAVDIDGAVQIDATFTSGVDGQGYDTKFFGDTSSAYMLWDTSADDLVLAGAAGIDLAGDIDVDGTANLDAVDIDGAVQIDGTVTVGVDNTGLDVKFFGASAGAYALWDESANLLDLRGATAAGPGYLKLTTGELTVVDADILGRIDFQAPLESDGTDSILVAASIYAEADDTFSASVNNTDIVFATGKSETAAEKFRFTADNEIGVAGANYGTDGQVLTSGGAGAAVAWEDASVASGAVAGKTEGTDFTNSLLVGHSTTGTLSSAIYNLGVGIDALDALTDGQQNVALGTQAGTAITGGDFNTFVGAQSGEATVSVQNNTGVGYVALGKNTAAANTAVGSAASYQNRTGTYNTAVGFSALEGVSTNNHSYNTAIGTKSNELVTTGGYNVTIGANSGDNITSGDGNIIIGSVDAASATDDAQLKITSYDGTTTVNWIAGDSDGHLTFINDVILDSDSCVLKFGDDQDVTLTHTDGTGLTLNSTSKLCFYDTALSIHSSTDGQLDLIADTEIQIAATTIDINGAIDVSGNATFGGLVDVNGVADGLVIDADGDTTISSPTDDQIDFEISGADDFTMTANTFTILSGSTIAIAAGGAITNAGSMAPDITSTGKALVFGF